MNTVDALTYDLSEPLNGATTANVDVHAGDGNLMIDTLTGGEPLLASGTLQYVEKQGVPNRALSLDNGHAVLVLRGGQVARPRFRMPWDACNGATDWQVHLNPDVQSDIIAHTDGGNVRLDLTGLALTRLMADTGGGNVDVVLPDNAAGLNATAKSGAGNVTVEVGTGTRGSNTLSAKSGAGNVVVHVPNGIAVRVLATSGFGKVIVDSRFGKIDRDIYQSPDYDGAADKVDITAQSGAGNVVIETR